MIEVNLLPGGKKRQSRGSGLGGLSLSLPDMGALKSADPWIVGAVAAGVAALGFIGWSYTSVSDRSAEVTAAVEEAARDSARYADLISQTQRLTARRDSIAEKVEIIQEIDADRYVWPHLMDEVARALPDYTWLTTVVQTSASPVLEFRIDGLAGNNFALTTFMESLEASPYIRRVSLVESEQTRVTGQSGGPRTVYQFTLDAEYQEPPEGIVETVPLFGPDAPEIGDVMESEEGAADAEPAEAGAGGGI